MIDIRSDEKNESDKKNENDKSNYERHRLV